MKKKVLSYMLAGVLTAGVAYAVPVFAQTEGETSTTDTLVEASTKELKKLFRGKGGFHGNEEVLKEQAEKLGIETEGKEINELAKEVRAAMLKKKAAELGIETEGKESQELAKDIREVELKKEAAELGISTEGKEFSELASEVYEAKIMKQAETLGITIENKELRELAKEVHEKKVLQAAEKLGIETTDKSTRELMKEIMTNHAEEAKELNLFPNKGKGYFFGEGKGGHHKGSYDHTTDTEKSTNKVDIL
jgi:hypothetical protein